jgi:tetratricopeptide (TPR) repeat protein
MLLASLLTGAMDAPGPSALTEALAREDTGDTASALAGVEAVVAAQPDWALARLEAARLLLKLGGGLDRAEAHLEAAGALAPDNPRVHFLRGQVWEERAKPFQAMQAYEEALRLRPSYEEARFRLASVCVALGDWLKAELHYRTLSRARPEWIQVRLQLAEALERQGRAADAEGELVRLREAYPGNALVTRRLAELYERTGRPQLAEKLRASLEGPPRRKLRELKPSRR